MSDKHTSCSVGTQSTLFGSMSDATPEDMGELLGVVRSLMSVVPHRYPGMESHARQGSCGDGERRSSGLDISHGGERRGG